MTWPMARGPLAPVSSMAAVTSSPSSASAELSRQACVQDFALRALGCGLLLPARGGERVGRLPAPFRLLGEHRKDLVVAEFPRRLPRPPPSSPR